MQYVIKRQKKFEWGVRAQCFPATTAGSLEWVTLTDKNDDKLKAELTQTLPCVVDALPLTVEGVSKDGKAFKATHLRIL